MRAALAVGVGLALAAAAWGQPTEFAAGEPRHFVLLFGADAGPLRLGKTHTWAVYARAAGCRVVEAVPVSWLPADGTIDLLHPLRPERGRLYTHAETVAFCRGAGEKVVGFDPLEIDAARYDAAMGEVAKLRSGRVCYVAADGHKAGDDAPARNCIVAVIGCDPEVGRLPHRWHRLGIKGTGEVWDRFVASGARPAPEAAPWLLPAATGGAWAPGR